MSICMEGQFHYLYIDTMISKILMKYLCLFDRASKQMT
uniref:Uncharacterized protein n=1 Tax=Lepeophtheirus salmonis TaxID=72036 RepID=A0A0K2VEA9_LEPSM